MPHPLSIYSEFDGSNTFETIWGQEQQHTGNAVECSKNICLEYFTEKKYQNSCSSTNKDKELK